MPAGSVLRGYAPADSDDVSVRPRIYNLQLISSSAPAAFRAEARRQSNGDASAAVVGATGTHGMGAKRKLGGGSGGVGGGGGGRGNGKKPGGQPVARQQRLADAVSAQVDAEFSD